MTPPADTILILGAASPTTDRLRAALAQAGFQTRQQDGPTVRALRECDFVLVGSDTFLPVPHENEAASAPLGLTARQMEIARLMAVGMTQDEIAQFLGIDVGTVRGHLRTCYEKTGAPNAPALAWRLAMALRGQDAPLPREVT